jgi:hypothetical protein
MAAKCTGCGLVVFGDEASCRRCGMTLDGPAARHASGSAYPVGLRSSPPPGPAPAPRRSLSLGVGGLVVLLVIGGGVAFFFRGRATAHWQEFTPPDGRFTATLPAYPTERVEVKDDAGIATHAFVADVGELGAAGVSYYDLTPLIDKVGSVTAPQREKVMFAIDADLKDSMKKKLGATVTRQEWAILQNSEGIIAEGSLDPDAGTALAKRDAKLAVQIFWAPPDRIYVVTVLGPETGPIYAERERVFQSVRIQP